MSRLLEKYELNSLNDYIGKEKFVEYIREWVDDDDLPHLILSGPPGTAKTSFARCIIKLQFGNNRLDVKELNGSNERGIDVIRGLDAFISMKSWTGKRRIVFIDEAEQLTPDAWKALKVMTNDNRKTCVFIFATNHPDKIPEAIRSRCWEEIFDPNTDETMMAMVDRVLTGENIKRNPTMEIVIRKIVELSHGDMRTMMETYIRNLVSNPDMRLDELPGGSREKIIEIFKSILGKLKDKPEYLKMTTILVTIQKLRAKIPVSEIVLGIVHALESVKLAKSAGFVLSWIRQGVPEEVALTSFSAEIVEVL